MVSNMCRECPRDDNNETSFDMDALRAHLHLPQKRKGLSAFYTGKSKSFTSLADAHCLEDLKKPEIPKAKKSKYTHAQQIPCRSIPDTANLVMPYQIAHI